MPYYIKDLKRDPNLENYPRGSGSHDGNDVVMGFMIKRKVSIMALRSLSGLQAQRIGRLRFHARPRELSEYITCTAQYLFGRDVKGQLFLRPHFKALYNVMFIPASNGSG